MKKQTVNSYLILTVALAGGLLGFALRCAMQNDASWAYPALWGLSALAFFALIPLCVRIGKVSGDRGDMTAQPIARGILPPAIATGLGGAALLIAFTLQLLGGGLDTLEQIAAILGLLGGGCLLIQAYLRHMGKSSAAAAGVITVALAVSLISRFRHWSSDPLLEDYCFQLLSHVFSMLAAYYLMGYSIGKGTRRLCVFYSMNAAFFSLICVGDAGASSMAFYLGLALWLALGTCELTPQNAPLPQNDEEEL